MQEMFKDIEEFEGLYQVSTKGYVISLERKVKFHYGLRSVKERILKPHINTKGYKQVSLCKNGIRKDFLISRLVAIAFLPNPENKRTVNHKLGDILDNNHDQLEWMTYSENHKHAYKYLGRKSRFIGKKGKDNPSSIPVIQMTKGGKYINTFASQHEAARALNIDQGTISRVCAGKLNISGGFRWKYDI